MPVIAPKRRIPQNSSNFDQHDWASEAFVSASGHRFVEAIGCDEIDPVTKTTCILSMAVDSRNQTISLILQTRIFLVIRHDFIV